MGSDGGRVESKEQYGWMDAYMEGRKKEGGVAEMNERKNE